MAERNMAGQPMSNKMACPLNTVPESEDQQVQSQEARRSSSIISWAQTISRRESEDRNGSVDIQDPAVQAYMQAKMALFDRALYIRINGS